MDFEAVCKCAEQGQLVIWCFSWLNCSLWSRGPTLGQISGLSGSFPQFLGIDLLVAVLFADSGNQGNLICGLNLDKKGWNRWQSHDVHSLHIKHLIVL